MDADFWCRLKPGGHRKATIKLLDDDKARQAMRERAYLYARPMVWKAGCTVLYGHHSASACPSCGAGSNRVCHPDEYQGS